MNLKERFYGLFLRYSEDENLLDAYWDEIETNYSAKQRKYHNLTHLEEIFGYFDMHLDALECPDILAFSVFYHDVIYNVFKKDNELKSAELAVKRLRDLGFSENELSVVYEQIMATKTHDATDNDTCYFVDFDLAILGQSRDVYLDYAQKIRAEYRLIPSFVYKKGRKKVLQHFLAKDVIYKTAIFKETLEQKARENLAFELLGL